MIKTEIQEVLKRYQKVHPEDDFGVQQIWDEETEILSRDIADTIKFIETDCDDETFYWIGEVFYEVVERTQSKEFVAAIKKRAEKVVDAEEKRSVQVDVSFAEDTLSDG